MLHPLLCVAILAPLVMASASEAPVVRVADGRVSGITETSKNGREFYSYYGIPFAKPPVGELRLKDPVKADPWKGVRDGSVKPSCCLLVPFGNAVMGIYSGPEHLEGDEDCLYLNVFKPKIQSTEKLPVMVWIHGGGFFAGGAYEYLPHVLMNEDIVLVVLQYRLGILGFLSTEDEVMPGNFGLKDQTLALRWVQDNIHTFGGDAKRVTIFGESAGGASVHYQMLSPGSKGLFSRVIMQSGSALAPWAIGRDFKNVAMNVSKAVGCPEGLQSNDLLACLQKSDSRKLASTFQDFMIWSILPLVTLPRVDGVFLPDEPAKLIRDGKFHQVDLMAGITRDEGAIITQSMVIRDDLLTTLQENFDLIGPISLILDDEVSDPVAYSKRLYKHYFGELIFDLDHLEENTKMISDITFLVPHDLTTQYHAKHSGASTYRYELKHRSQLSFGDFFPSEIGRHWIPHADDLYYVFAGGPMLAPEELVNRPKDFEHKEDLELRDIVTTMWTNFAATGNPTPDNSLGFKWEASTSEDLRFLALKPKPTMEEDQRKEARDFLATLPSKINKILHPERILADGSSFRSSQDEL